jgi:hypothetical protein
MKKILAVVVLAALIAGGTNQKASAWCKFNFSCGCNLTFEKGDPPGSTCSLAWTKTCNGQPGCGMALPSEHISGGYPQVIQPAPATPAQPAFPPAPKPAENREGNQPASYWNYGYNTNYASPSTGYTMYPQTGYGYGGAPSYWYGR